MTPYADRNRDSGIESYEHGNDFIRVRFKKGGQYLYNNEKPGSNHVETMKKLADKGSGLNSYINTYVRGNYAVKEE